jgi:hypothetical protein
MPILAQNAPGQVEDSSRQSGPTALSGPELRRDSSQTVADFQTRSFNQGGIEVIELDPFQPTGLPQRFLLRNLFPANNGITVEFRRRAQVIASFLGRLTSLSGPTAYVTMRDQQSGDEIESTCDSTLLRTNGISMGDEFRCEVLRIGGRITTRFSKLSARRISRRRVEDVRRNFEARWTF